MPSLSEKLAQIEAIKSELDEVLQDLKAQNQSEIQSAVEIATENKADEIQKALKSEISSELSAHLEQKSDESHAALKEFVKDEASKNAALMLDDKEFKQNLEILAQNAVENKVEKKLERFDMLVLQFKNATTCFKLCLSNELFIYSEALKNISAIEFYEKKLRENGIINKVYKVI